MKLRSLTRSLFLLVGSLALVGCGADGNEEDDQGVSGESAGELRRLSPAEIVGDLVYGQTSAVAYTRQPTYRAFRFTAAAGDEVDTWVRSEGGNARAWLLDSNFRNVEANDDADANTTDAHITKKLEDAGTYYVAFREKNGKSAELTVSLAKKVQGPGPNKCVRAFRQESRSGCYYAGQPGCEKRTVVYCEDGAKSPPQRYFTHWFGMASFCAGHCVDGIERLHLGVNGSIPITTDSFQHGSCPYPVGFSGNTTSLELEVLGPVDSPFVTWSGSSAGAKSVEADGRFSFGNLSGRLDGATVDGKFVMANPPTITITSFSYYTNGGSGGTCGASMKLAAETKLALTPR